LYLELPSELRVSICHPSDPSKVPSEGCADVLGRLLDPRQWRRLGAGANFSLLQHHTWLEEVGLSWDDVISRRCPSPILIDRARIHFDLTYKYLFDELMDEEQGSELPRRKVAPSGLSAAENHILDRFHYSSPSFSRGGRSSSRCKPKAGGADASGGEEKGSTVCPPLAPLRLSSSPDATAASGTGTPPASCTPHKSQGLGGVDLQAQCVPKPADLLPEHDAATCNSGISFSRAAAATL
jgi:hypothetical protein